ncbi:MAG: tRNA pseudouridine(55) synthase TruB [Patescibacteria group bacterium]|nr:tRNA pseudouridine(55) synthase TruB [Patescibacteria group bacterium]
MKEGFILIDKPKGITSFGVVACLRKITGIKKIGHCGTLDPLASGLLICAIGRSATKRIDSFIKQDKTYLAEIELGKISDTYDAEGKIKKTKFKNKPTRKDVKKVLEMFMGEINQVPPIYSAKKVDGVRAYQLARKGKKVKLKENKIKIYKIKIVSYKFPFLKIKVNCGSGTYIRSLTHDIGKKLKTGGLLVGLIRESIGKYSLKKSLELEKLNLEKIEKHIFAK